MLRSYPRLLFFRHSRYQRNTSAKLPPEGCDDGMRDCMKVWSRAYSLTNRGSQRGHSSDTFSVLPTVSGLQAFLATKTLNFVSFATLVVKFYNRRGTQLFSGLAVKVFLVR
jgi:hypothetical protein